jgi:hypothetical protein
MRAERDRIVGGDHIEAIDEASQYSTGGAHRRRARCRLGVVGARVHVTVFSVPTVYSWWKQVQCWLRGADSYACWELDLLKSPKRDQH